MLTQPSRPVPSRSLLLEVLARPEATADLIPATWDDLVRVARAARLLGTLRHRLAASKLLEVVPAAARRHLESDFMLARFQQQAVRSQLRELETVLQHLPGPLVALKGAAYVLQGTDSSQGRFLSDVDLMLPREQLDEAEGALKDAGWTFEDLGDYDERYYREWVHELPPMRCPGYYLELDLHHAILPLTGRVQPDTRALFEDSMALPDSRFRVLSPSDQVLHACAHLAQDSDFTERLRDLVDVDALVREWAAIPSFWDGLIARAQKHGLGRALWYCLHYGRMWLSTPVPAGAVARLDAWRPAPAVRWAMDWMVSRTLLPGDPDRDRLVSSSAAAHLLFLRSHWLRMPLPLLIRHATVKGLRRCRALLPSASRGTQPAQNV